MLFIIDPWIWIALGLSVWLSLRRERAGMARWPRPAWTGFAAVCAYIHPHGLITGRAETQDAALLPRPGQGEPPVVPRPPPPALWKGEVFCTTRRPIGLPP